MKKLIIALVALLPITLMASEPIRLNGQYPFKEVKAAIARDTELVPSMNSKRFNELVADHYDCYLRGEFYYCQKFLHNVDMPEDLKNDMNMLWAGRFFDFKASSSAPSITNESEDLMEWDIFDDVKFESATASGYHYYLLRGEGQVHKIVINLTSGPKWLVIENKNRIFMLAQRTVEVSQLKSRIFDLEVYFNRTSN